jgi:predicted Zn-dependent peptidase
MAYARKSNENELVRLRDEITDEVNGDASHIAQSVFGDAAQHPDVGRVSNQQLESTYRRAYQSGDRTFLQSEARRDPQQFLKVIEKIGVRIPPPTPPPVPVSPPPPGLAAGAAPPMDMLQAIMGSGAPALSPAALPAAPVMPGLSSPAVPPSGPVF